MSVVFLITKGGHLINAAAIEHIDSENMANIINDGGRMELIDNWGFPLNQVIIGADKVTVAVNNT